MAPCSAQNPSLPFACAPARARAWPRYRALPSSVCYAVAQMPAAQRRRGQSASAQCMDRAPARAARRTEQRDSCWRSPRSLCLAALVAATLLLLAAQLPGSTHTVGARPAAETGQPTDVAPTSLPAAAEHRMPPACPSARPGIQYTYKLLNVLKHDPSLFTYVTLRVMREK